MRTWGHVLLAGLLVTAATGCNAETGTALPAQTTTTTTTASATAALPSATAPAMATDGVNYAACGDGNCEVVVSGPAEIPVGGSLGAGTLSVTAVNADGIDFKLALGAGSSSGSLKGNCMLTFVRGGGGSSCSSKPMDPPAPKVGTVAMQLGDVRPGAVVLRLVTG
ncbi:MAG: hypothetical protein ABW215_06150 [Kibdelosporangium sp.]